MIDIYVTANSPGELAGWVAPVVGALRSCGGPLRITLVLMPCQYASGGERAMGETMKVDRVMSWGQCLLRRPWKDAPTRRVVLHMGGDVGLSVMLSRFMRAQLYVYSYRPRWKRFVRHFFVPSSEAAANFSASKMKDTDYTVVGYPVFDSVSGLASIQESRHRLGMGVSNTLLGMMCGSRPFEAIHCTPFFASAAGILLERFRELEIVFPMAPSINPDDIIKSLDDAGIEWQGRVRPHEIRVSEDRWVRMVWNSAADAMGACDMLVSLPGTNNLQAAALRIPLLVVIPLNRAWEIPLDGLLGHAPMWIPGVKSLKKNLIMKKSGSVPYLSLPNRIAGRKIVPELVGELIPEDVAEAAADILIDKDVSAQMITAFAEMDGKFGGASLAIAMHVMGD